MRHQLSAVLLAGLALTAGELLAQERPPLRVRIAELRAVPRDVADEIEQVFNAPGTRRASGAITIPASDTLNGDLAALRGSIVIEGLVAGRVVVINGSVTVRGNGHVGGAVIAVGGTVSSRGGGAIAGAARSYPEPVSVEELEEEIRVRDETDDERWYRRQLAPPARSRGDLRLVTTRTYNRVEGLPLLLGPRAYLDFDWGRVTADAMGVLRSADGFQLKSENLGHLLRLEVRLGGVRGLRLMGGHDDVVAPVEDWHLSDSEVGLASFLLHRDYRDYYRRRGGGFGVSAPVGSGLTATMAWADERWASLPARDPWSLLRDQQDWRPNPELDEGHFRFLRASLRYDTRNDEKDPWSGWLVIGNYEYGIGLIDSYGATTRGIRDINPTGRNNYDRLMLDVRRYSRLSAEGQLNLRLLAGGWLSGDDLPLQRRLSLGSAGTLPGYPFRQVRSGTDFLTCAGSRAAGAPGGPRSPEGTPAQCERVLLAQVEYRGEVGSRLFGILDAERRRRRFGWGRRAEWVLFADLGRGWLVGPRAGDLQYPGWALPGLSTFRADAGVGIRLDDLGLYIAKSVTDARTPFNFFARLQPRF